jgi:hypothetical protein
VTERVLIDVKGFLQELRIDIEAVLARPLPVCQRCCHHLNDEDWVPCNALFKDETLLHKCDRCGRGGCSLVCPTLFRGRSQC